VETITSNLQAFRAKLQSAAEQAINDGLEPVFQESQGLVPVDTGRLKGSGQRHDATTQGNVVTGVISYGNEDTITDWHGVGYEILVHTPGTKFYGGVPYLEQPVADAKGTIGQTMAESFKRNLR
jgi:hypothetical protein